MNQHPPTEFVLPLEDYQRYGRQMILDDFGLPGQLKLQQASVVVVGAGGLGCPALQYLGAAGIGRIGIVDHDVVEVSNLQRQVLHSEETIGKYKADSAAMSLKRLNSRLNIDIITTKIVAENATSLLESYDVILDCTDNAPTRYLLSDAAVVLGKPLISGAAQKFEGQLCVYNLGADGPCYRCLFPVPPPTETLGTCEETGILGAVTGIIGNLQALEAIKILTGLHDLKPTLLLYSAISFPPFRSVKLRSRKSTCPACGISNGSVTAVDYVQFCGGPPTDWQQNGLVMGDPGNRVTVHQLHSAVLLDGDHVIIDVRPPIEFGICQLPLSINIPLKEIISNPKKHLLSYSHKEIFVVCRLGNDSQTAAQALRSVGGKAKDVIGGLRAWSNNIDKKFPIY